MEGLPTKYAHRGIMSKALFKLSLLDEEIGELIWHRLPIDIKNGSVLNLDGQLWAIISSSTSSRARAPLSCTTIKNVLSGKIIDKTFNAGMKMEFETVDNRNLQYSYEDGDNFVFMDMTTYNQIYIPKTLVGDQASFLWKEPAASCPSTMAPRCPSNCRLP